VVVHYLANRHPDALREFGKRLADFEDPGVAWNAPFPEWSLDKPGATEAIFPNSPFVKRQEELTPLRH
jgi:hypothetical protein